MACSVRCLLNVVVVVLVACYSALKVLLLFVLLTVLIGLNLVCLHAWWSGPCAGHTLH